MMKKATDIEQKCEKVAKRSEFMLGMERGRARRPPQSARKRKGGHAGNEKINSDWRNRLVTIASDLVLHDAIEVNFDFDPSNGHWASS